MSLQPFLLTSANLLGTLAAVRCLGRCGIPTTVADSGLLRRAMWSTYASRRARTAAHEPDVYLEWLLDFGARNPGHVLYPTDDETAWLLSLHREALSRHYTMYSPPFESIRRLL